jgi:actin-related protein
MIIDKNNGQQLDWGVSRKIKEKMCLVVPDYDDALKQPQQSYEYKLPDQRLIKLGNERFKCAEALFKPELISSDCESIHRLCYNTINSCAVDLRSELYEQIVLSGGNTLFDGLAKRLTAEV